MSPVKQVLRIGMLNSRERLNIESGGADTYAEPYAVEMGC
jgi:hypothetical protein